MATTKWVKKIPDSENAFRKAVKKHNSKQRMIIQRAWMERFGMKREAFYHRCTGSVVPTEADLEWITNFDPFTYATYGKSGDH